MSFQVNLLRPGENTPERFQLEDGAYFIGRGASCVICLPYPEISERHAFVTLSGNQASIKDMRSSNGTYVNNMPVDDLVRLAPDSIVQIGNCMLRFCPADNDAHLAAHAETRPPIRSAATYPTGGQPSTFAAKPQSQPVDRTASDILRKAKEQIQAELITRLDLKRLTAQGVDRDGLEDLAREKIHEIVNQVQGNNRLPKGIDAERLEREVFNEALRLGPLEALLADETVTEIMVNGPHRVYVERHGRLELTDMQFTDDASVMAVIERIVAPLGRRIDESQPYVDARLADGSRVNAIIPPLAISGPTVTIRKFAKRALTTEDFIRFGTWTHNAAEFMRACVIMRKNIIVAGGTGSGKTTLLNLLSGFIPETERIVTVEDAAELKLQQPHVVRLEARPPNIEGRGAVTIRDLVKNCLRMRPDRIIVGECRGGEALDMLQAMNTGHDGSLTTIHANSPRDALARLETLVLMAGFDLPLRAIREQIASAISIIVQINREKDGSRKVVCVSEITKMEGDIITMQDLFEFRQDGWSEDGRLLGHFEPTGAIPTFIEDIRRANLDLDLSMFSPTPRAGKRGGI